MQDLVLEQGSNTGTLYWEHGVLITRPPETSPHCGFKLQFCWHQMTLNNVEKFFTCLLVHLLILLCEFSIQVFYPLKNYFSFIIELSESSMYSTHKSFVRYMFCDCFLSFHTTFWESAIMFYVLAFFFLSSFCYLSGSGVHLFPSPVFLGICRSC